MGKIVKFCAKCEEGFAAKFGFCPNCGENLQAFEMNPVQPETIEPVTNNIEMESVASETLPLIEEPILAETAAFSGDDVLELDSVDVAESPAEETETFTAASSTYFYDNDSEDDQDYDDYHVTVIEEKDVQLRNGLLISLACLVVSATMIAWVVSIFVHALPVDALGESELFAYVGPIDDKPIDIEKEKKKDDEEGGGGGGGGKERDQDANRGDLPNQSRNPSNYITPMEQRDFELQQVNVTDGQQTNRQLTQPTGIPNSLLSGLSSGRGSGDGIGNGNGNGVGNGIGTGNGNGNGSGEGNGNGNGNGDGDGDGDGDGPTIKPKPVGVTQAINITFKPQAKYTDAARQNNVQGTVTLRVTFTASGAIGTISPVSGLPYGLTEQAISAARQMRFEPKKVNGVAQSVTKTVSYSFTIY